MQGGHGAVLGPEIGAFAIVADAGSDGSWSELRRVPRASAALSVATPAVQYALSVFEGLKAYRAPSGAFHLFRGAAHAARFRKSAERMCMPAVPEELFLRACRAAVAAHPEMVPAFGSGSLYLRPTLYGTEEYLGVRTAAAHQFSVVVTPSAELGLKSVRLRAERDYVRAAPGGGGAAKTGGNYGAALYAQRLAHRAGFDDVLWLDAAHHRDIGEAGTMNVFFVLRDRVVTPALDGTILAGITRDSCLKLLRERGVVVEERTVPLAEIAAAAGRGELLDAFGTGTALRLVHVGAIQAAIDGREITITPNGSDFSARLREELAAIQDGSAPDRHGWRERIDLERSATA